MRWATQEGEYSGRSWLTRRPYSVSSPKIRFSITIGQGRMRHAHARRQHPQIHRDEARDISTTRPLCAPAGCIQGFFGNDLPHMVQQRGLVRQARRLTYSLVRRDGIGSGLSSQRPRPLAPGEPTAHAQRAISTACFNGARSTPVCESRYRPIWAWTSALTQRGPTGGSPQTCHHS